MKKYYNPLIEIEMFVNTVDIMKGSGDDNIPGFSQGKDPFEDGEF